MSRYRWPKPEGIPTAMTLPEIELLQDYAHEAGNVLEIGTHFGFSCIGMALAGAHVTSVDPHYEGPANAPDTWEPFLANAARNGILVGGPGNAGMIMPWRKSIEDWEYSCQRGWQIYGETRYGLVFIDGDHVWPHPWRDAEVAMRHLCEPGYIAYHDVTPRWPGVWRAAQELEASGRAVKLRQVGTLAVYHCKASSVSGMSSSPTEAL